MSCPGTWHTGVPGGAPAVDRWAASKLTKGSILPALPAPLEICGGAHLRPLSHVGAIIILCFGFYMAVGV